jgi:hypothetical protein
VRPFCCRPTSVLTYKTFAVNKRYKAVPFLGSVRLSSSPPLPAHSFPLLTYPAVSHHRRLQRLRDRRAHRLPRQLRHRARPQRAHRSRVARVHHRATQPHDVCGRAGDRRRAGDGDDGGYARYV